MKLRLAPSVLLAITLLPSLALSRPTSHVRLQGGSVANQPTHLRRHMSGANIPVMGDGIPTKQTATIERRQAKGQAKNQAETADQPAVVDVGTDPADLIVVRPDRVRSALEDNPVRFQKLPAKVPGKSKAKRQTNISLVNYNGSPSQPAARTSRRSFARRQTVGLVNNQMQVAPSNNASPRIDPATPNVPTPAAPAPQKRSEGKRKDYDAQDLETLTQTHFLTTLLSSYYVSGLSRFSVNDFINAGYPDWVRGRYEQIKESGKVHDKFLGTALELGKKPEAKGKANARVDVQGCDFSFEFDGVKQFVDQSLLLETVVTSALNSLLGFMNNKAYTAILGSIMSVEGRHAAWISSSVKMGTPWNSAFETPLSMNQAYTLLGKYVKSCPTSYDPRPKHKFNPPVDIQFLISGTAIAKAVSSTDSTQNGRQAVLSFDLPKEYEGKRLFAALVRGMGTVFVPLSSRAESNGGTKEKKDDRKVTMNINFPKGLAGVVYVLVVSEENMPIKEGQLVAGPGVAWFEFDSKWIA